MSVSISDQLWSLYRSGDEIEQLAMAVFLDRREEKFIRAFAGQSEVLVTFARLVGIEIVDVGADNITAG